MCPLRAHRLPVFGSSPWSVGSCLESAELQTKGIRSCFSGNIAYPSIRINRETAEGRVTGSAKNILSAKMLRENVNVTKIHRGGNCDRALARGGGRPNYGRRPKNSYRSRSNQACVRYGLC